MSTFLGLDISSTSSGALIICEGKVETHALWQPPAAMDYLERGSYQAERLLEMLKYYDPTEICIEGYSLGSTNGAEPLITVGTIIRYFLRQQGYTWWDVAPTQLKKFAGAKYKEDIKLEAFKRWGFEHKSNDVVDAFVLAKIAEGLGEAAPLIGPQKEVVAALRKARAEKAEKLLKSKKKKP